MRKRYEFALRKNQFNQQDKGQKKTDDEDGSSDGDEEELDDSMMVVPKGEARVFFEGQAMPMSQIRKWTAQQITSIIDEQSERIAQTQD